MNFRAILPLSSARRRAMPGMPIAAGLIAACVATAPVAHGQDSTSESSDTEINYTFDGGINAVAEENLYWNLADRFAPSANFDSDTQWLEVYAKPGVEITHNADQALQFYGGFSVVASATLGTDAFDQKNTSRLTIEEAYVGFRTGTVETGQFDLSVGAQELKLGTGMLTGTVPPTVSNAARPSSAPARLGSGRSSVVSAIRD